MRIGDVPQIGDAAQYSGFDTYAKTGTSAWTLTGDNTETDWRIDAGTLLVNGSIGDVAVDGGVLAGIGTVAAITLDSGGRIAPGGSPGTLNGASLTWNSGGGFDFQLGSTPDASDLLSLSGALSKGDGNGFVWHFSDAGGPPVAGNTYTLITFGELDGFDAADFGTA